MTEAFDPLAPVCADLYDTIGTSQALAATMVAQTASADAAVAEPVTSSFGGARILHRTPAWREQGPFWAFSNARYIDFAAGRCECAAEMLRATQPPQIP